MYNRRRKPIPTAKEIADALEKVREERKKNSPTPGAPAAPAAPPFSLVHWIRNADPHVLSLPGTALMIVSWVLELGGGKPVNVALAERWRCTPEAARKRLIEECYACGWLAEALLGGHARRHQDKTRAANFREAYYSARIAMNGEKTGPAELEGPPA